MAKRRLSKRKGVVVNLSIKKILERAKKEIKVTRAELDAFWKEFGACFEDKGCKFPGYLFAFYLWQEHNFEKSLYKMFADCIILSNEGESDNPTPTSDDGAFFHFIMYDRKMNANPIRSTKDIPRLVNILCTAVEALSDEVDDREKAGNKDMFDQLIVWALHAVEIAALRTIPCSPYSPEFGTSKLENPSEAKLFWKKYDKASKEGEYSFCTGNGLWVGHLSEATEYAKANTLSI